MSTIPHDADKYKRDNVAGEISSTALLSDNGPSYVSTELAAWLDKRDMRHIRGAPYHPMTQGKIERWHLTLKKPHPVGELLSAQRDRGPDRPLYQPQVMQTGAVA